VGDTSATNTVSDHPENELLLRQLVYADKILINKVDLLEKQGQPGAIDFIETCIRKVNADAHIEQCSYAQVDLEKFLETLEGVRASKKKIEGNIASKE